MTEATWPVKPKVYTIGLFTEKIANLWSMASILFYFPWSEAELLPEPQSFCFVVRGHLNEAEVAFPGSQAESR